MISAPFEPSRAGHVGLWLDRMLAEPNRKDKEWQARHRLYQAAIASLTPGQKAEQNPPALQSYGPRYKRWRALVEQPTAALWRRCLVLEASSRILLHPQSNASVTEGSLLLHHTYGVPYLPGSAIKGAVRSRLRMLAEAATDSEKRRLKAARQVLLGSLDASESLARLKGEEEVEEPQTRAAVVDFLDALWIPERPPEIFPGWSPLALDVVNPHYPSYYTRTGADRQPARDSDSPIPIHRLTIAPGSRFLLVMEAQTSPQVEPWLDWLVRSILLPALAEQGIGAWTSAGYGRLRPLNWCPEPSGEPTKTRPPKKPEWQRARVLRQPSTRTLVAQCDDGRQADCAESETEGLLAELSEQERAQFSGSKKKKGIFLEARLEQRGRAWWILALRRLQ